MLGMDIAGILLFFYGGFYGTCDRFGSFSFGYVAHFSELY